MHSLWTKLMGAFVLVILVGTGMVVFLMRQTTANQFELYITQPTSLNSTSPRRDTSGRFNSPQLQPTTSLAPAVGMGLIRRCVIPGVTAWTPVTWAIG